jgi:hypothetical protein
VYGPETLCRPEDLCLKEKLGSHEEGSSDTTASTQVDDFLCPSSGTCRKYADNHMLWKKKDPAVSQIVKY